MLIIFFLIKKFIEKNIDLNQSNTKWDSIKYALL